MAPKYVFKFATKTIAREYVFKFGTKTFVATRLSRSATTPTSTWWGWRRPKCESTWRWWRGGGRSVMTSQAPFDRMRPLSFSVDRSRAETLKWWWNKKVWDLRLSSHFDLFYHFVGFDSDSTDIRNLTDQKPILYK